MMDPGMMAAPMPPMGAPPMGPPMGGPPMGPPMATPVDENAILMQLLQATLAKWGGEEAELAGEKSTLMHTLMMLIGVQPPGPADAFAESPDGMLGPSEDDIPGEY